MPRLSAAGLAALLLTANLYLCRELFRIEWITHMWSIEGAYIGLSRWIMGHFPDLAWMPAWYGGIPFQNTYPPLLHFLVAVVAKIGSISPPLAHHATSAFFYAIGPIAVFALALRLCGSQLAAFVAALGYSLLSPSAWLIPAVARDMGSLWHPRRLQALAYFGEGPHVSALTWLPLAILCVVLAVENRKPLFYCAAILTLAATVATNWIAAFSLALAMIAYLAARTPRLLDLVRLALLAIAAYALISPWIPPSTIAVIQENAKTIGGDYRQLYQTLPRWGTLAAVALTLLKIFAGRVGWSWQQQFAAFFVFLTAGVTLLAAWAHVDVVPQATRYHLEMEMAMWIAVAVTMAQIPRRAQQVAATALILLCVWAGRHDRHFARAFLLKSIDIKQRTEYKTAKWMDENLHGERVYVPGATSFFFQAFTDTPQLAGGFENGTTNFNFRVANYTLYEGSPPFPAGLGILWLKALGVQAIAYGGQDSGEYYKPIKHPENFAHLEVLWRDGGDVIARVPQRSKSLARVVTRKDLTDIEAYVKGLDDPSLPLTEWRWTTQHSAKVTAVLEPHHLLSIQESWAPGWHAIANGKTIPVVSDGLGLMLVEPVCNGACSIELMYDGGHERQLAIAASFFTMLAMVAWCIRGAIFKFR